MSQRYTAQEREFLEELLKQEEPPKREEQPKELRDYSSAKFGERYQEFCDEHKKKIVDTLNSRYVDYSVALDHKIINYTDCVGFVSLPLVMLAFMAVDSRLRILAIIALVTTLALAFFLIQHYKEKSIKALFREYERKRILTDYVRREEDSIISKLMYNDTIDSFYRECQYSRIKWFFEKVLEDLQEREFTEERY